MTNTYRIYNIHLVNGRVLSTPVCPILVDANLQPVPYFMVPVAIEKSTETGALDLSKRFQVLRINQQNLLFVDETTVASDMVESVEQLFKLETIDLNLLNSSTNS